MIQTTQKGFPEVQEELSKLMHESSLKGLPLLIFCNKQDLPRSMTVNEVVKKLDLGSIDRPWKAQALVAISGDGLYEGFDWLADKINRS